MEPPLHLPTVLGFRPLSSLAAAVDRDDRTADAQLLAAETMVVLTIEGRIAQDTIPTHDQGSLVQRRSKLWVVIGRPRADGGCRNEVAGGVADDGELGPK